MVLLATAARVFVACVCANATGAAVAMMAAKTAIGVILDIFSPDLNPDVAPTHRLAAWFLSGSIALSMSDHMEDVQQNDDRNWDSQQTKQHTSTHCTLLHIACENAQTGQRKRRSLTAQRVNRTALTVPLLRRRPAQVGARYCLRRRNQAAPSGDYCIFQDEEVI